MLIKDIMTKKIITAPSKMSIGDAKKILKENRFRRLPVVDNGKLLGIVTEDRLDRVSPSGGAPLLWQVGYLISHTTLKDVMEKSVVTIDPEATVEQGVALAQSRKVGALLVLKNDKLVGIVTTNDFFYNVLNPVLGIGQTGSRIIVNGGGDGKSAEKIIGAINKLGVDIKMMVTMAPPRTKSTDLIIQLSSKSATEVIKTLEKLGFSAGVRAR